MDLPGDRLSHSTIYSQFGRNVHDFTPLKIDFDEGAIKIIGYLCARLSEGLKCV
jgi:hypothetical protein